MDFCLVVLQVISVEEMEYITTEISMGIPSCPQKPSIASKPYPMTSPSTIIKLSTGSIEEKKKLYSMNNSGATRGGPKSNLEHLEVKSSPRSEDDEKIETLIQSPPSDDNPSAGASATKGGTSVKLEEAIEFELKHGRYIDPNMDPKKLRRTISNRLSAQRSRLRKTQYIYELEKKVKDLEAHISLVSPQIVHSKHHVKMLRLERSVLKQRLDSITDKSNLRR
ncbi:unnamed protein product, partial [Ilex paraguariensis]